jgi:hypothetical protein
MRHDRHNATAAPGRAEIGRPVGTDVAAGPICAAARIVRFLRPHRFRRLRFGAEASGRAKAPALHILWFKRMTLP